MRGWWSCWVEIPTMKVDESEDKNVGCAAEGLPIRGVVGVK